MYTTKKLFYLMVIFCLITASCSSHLQVEKGKKSAVQVEKGKKSAKAELPAKNHPRISFDSTSYNAGTVWEGEELSHTFTVKNTGTAMLTIQKVRPG